MTTESKMIISGWTLHLVLEKRDVVVKKEGYQGSGAIFSVG